MAIILFLASWPQYSMVSEIKLKIIFATNINNTILSINRNVYFQMSAWWLFNVYSEIMSQELF